MASLTFKRKRDSKKSLNVGGYRVLNNPGPQDWKNQPTGFYLIEPGMPNQGILYMYPPTVVLWDRERKLFMLNSPGNSLNKTYIENPDLINPAIFKRKLDLNHYYEKFNIYSAKLIKRSHRDF